MEIFSNILLALIVAVVASFLSIKVYTKNELWQKREQKYSELINQLLVMLKYYSDKIDDGHGPSFTKLNIINENEYENSIYKIELVSLYPAYLLDPKISKMLNNLVSSSKALIGTEALGNRFEYFDRMGAETKSTIEQINTIAKKHLNIKNN